MDPIAATGTVLTQELCTMPPSPAKLTPPVAASTVKRLVLFTDSLINSGANITRSHGSSGTRLERAPLTPVSGVQSQCSSASSSPSLTPLSQGQVASYPPSALSHQLHKDADVTAKLYILERSHIDPAVVAQSVTALCHHLGLERIDHLVVSFNEPRYDLSSSDHGSQVTWPLPLEQMLGVWQALEQELTKGRVGDLGVCEFSPAQLALFSAHTKVAPAVNQITINPQSPVPQLLLHYCKTHGIDLQNNVDGADIVTPQDMHRVVEKLGLDQVTDQSLAPAWVVKYHTFLKHRAIVTNKGYIVCAQ
ncbi:hypothetical protein H4R34_001191 [Dimargaris verticillata]|uniref:GCS light chain n=1 Tax=Dimargaris verticillata TaxID=2761393 RepID=A0A9W8BB83_9FUNG|nr:hypothetical protein H4R34_001191 [Dimargaris verticillata]